MWLKGALQHINQQTLPGLTTQTSVRRKISDGKQTGSDTEGKDGETHTSFPPAFTASVPQKPEEKLNKKTSEKVRRREEEENKTLRCQFHQNTENIWQQ